MCWVVLSYLYQTDFPFSPLTVCRFHKKLVFLFIYWKLVKWSKMRQHQNNILISKIIGKNQNNQKKSKNEPSLSKFTWVRFQFKFDPTWAQSNFSIWLKLWSLEIWVEFKLFFIQLDQPKIQSGLSKSKLATPSPLELSHDFLQFFSLFNKAHLSFYQVSLEKTKNIVN